MKHFTHQQLIGVAILFFAGAAGVYAVMTSSPSAPAALVSTEQDQQQIIHTLNVMFERPDAPLTIHPISIEGEYAVVGWIQGARGGRALLKKQAGQWSVRLCSGDGLMQVATLKAAGISADQATRLLHTVHQQERQLTPEQRHQLSLFRDTIDLHHQSHATAHGGSH